MENVRNIANFIIVILGFLWLAMFVTMVYYRFLEEKIYKNWENEAEKIRKQPIAMPFIDGQLKVLEKNFQPKIDKLDRKKQFIRDLIPFIKK